MADETFIFSPKSQVPETVQREPANVMTLGNWTFSAKPTTPHQRKFRVQLHGMTWFLNEDGTYDRYINPTMNAKLLEEFYERHETWKPFLWNHPHRGLMMVRFATAVNVPRGKENGGGFIDAFEINLIHHNPGFADDFSEPPTITGAPNNISLPTISASGPVEAGAVLTGTNGVWDNDPDEYLYSWERNGAVISGANTVNYTIQFVDRGKELKFVVRAKNPAGTSGPGKTPGVVVPAVTLDNTYANSTVLFANDEAFRTELLNMQQQIDALED